MLGRAVSRVRDEALAPFEQSRRDEHERQVAAERAEQEARKAADDQWWWEQQIGQLVESFYGFEMTRVGVELAQRLEAPAALFMDMNLVNAALAQAKTEALHSQ